jgi:hypothetical protein
MGAFIAFVIFLFIAGMFFVPELFGISKPEPKEEENKEIKKE